MSHSPPKKQVIETTPYYASKVSELSIEDLILKAPANVRRIIQRGMGQKTSQPGSHVLFFHCRNLFKESKHVST